MRILQGLQRETLDKIDGSTLVTFVFTGLVEGLGKVAEVTPHAGGVRLLIEVEVLLPDVQLGESISISGCCLTVVNFADTRLQFDLLAETLTRTNLSQLRPGSLVNLERAMAAGGRYGGHFVTGHVDATGTVRKWEQVGADFELRIGIEAAQGAYLVPKGCLAVDGISLTVAEVARDEFSVWIIPHTRAVTALSERKVGDAVNLEFDLLAKYTEKILAMRNVSGGS